jgi:hypothetical protein
MFARHLCHGIDAGIEFGQTLGVKIQPILVAP